MPDYIVNIGTAPKPKPKPCVSYFNRDLKAKYDSFRKENSDNLGGIFNIFHCVERVTELCGDSNDKPLNQAGVNEQSKAESINWALVLLQLAISTLFLYLFFKYQKLTLQVIGGLLGVYFLIKIVLLEVFLVQYRCLSRKKSKPAALVEPNKPSPTKYGGLARSGTEILVTIPVYNEDSEVVLETVSSVYHSNYRTKTNLMVLIIVDGFKETDQITELVRLLDAKIDIVDPIETKHNLLFFGMYQEETKGDTAKEMMPFAILVKDVNRGKRDSQWLTSRFLYILKEAERRPDYLLTLDSDTTIDPDALGYMVAAIQMDEKIVGVSGKMDIKNMSFYSIGGFSLGNRLYWLSTILVVGCQKYEYWYAQLFGKCTESAVKGVTCLAGAFSLIKTKQFFEIDSKIAPTSYKDDIIRDWEKENRITHPLLDKKVMVTNFHNMFAVDFWNRNLCELGEDRTLTRKLLENGYYTVTEPRAVAYTVCPDSIVQYLKQRRRWNNSTFCNLVASTFNKKILSYPRLWVISFFSLFEVIMSYLLPVNAALLCVYIWNGFFEEVTKATEGFIHLNATQVMVWWLGLTFVVVSATKIETSKGFYVFSSMITSVLMIGSAYTFATKECYEIFKFFLEDPTQYWAEFIILVVFPLIVLITVIAAALIKYDIWYITLSYLIFAPISFFVLLPTIAITLPLYSFMNMHDFSWGTR